MLHDYGTIKNSNLIASKLIEDLRLINQERVNSSLAVNLLSTDIFANNLDPDQDRQNVGPDLDPNHLKL